MKYRKKLSSKRSKKMFKRHSGHHAKNVHRNPQRGGIRL